MRLVLGVDSSTQSTKVEARNIETGEVIATGKAAHPPTGSPSSEQDPHAWWTALASAVGQLGDHRKDIVAMSVAGQQHGLVLLDENGDVLRPAKLWNDTTSAPQANALVERLGAQSWAANTGSVPVASFTVTKLAWVKENEPDVLERTTHVMLPHDYLTWRLTGRHVTDRGDASGSGWFSPTSGIYVPELLAAAVGDERDLLTCLPEVVSFDEAVGPILGSVAQELGLDPTVVVGPGTGDNMGAALGLGLQAGDVAMSLGTSGTVYSVSATPTADATGLVAGFADASGLFLPLVCTLNATRVTDSVATWLGTDPQGLSQLAIAAGASPDGLTLIPHFDGERTPNLPSATGTLTGLTTDTSRESIARAAHDGVLCGLFFGLDALTNSGVDATGALNLIGGGARSAAYQQRCADLYGAPVTIPDADEAVATGAALQAAAILDSRSFSEVAQAWNLGSGRIVEPRDDAQGAEIRSAFNQALTS